VLLCGGVGFMGVRGYDGCFCCCGDEECPRSASKGDEGGTDLEGRPCCVCGLGSIFVGCILGCVGFVFFSLSGFIVRPGTGCFFFVIFRFFVGRLCSCVVCFVLV